MTEIVYCYDGSFDGFLCCIFESYAQKEFPTDIISNEEFEPTLYPTRHIVTNPEYARRVYRKIRQLSPDAAYLVRRGFLTCMPNREHRLYLLVSKLLKEGSGFLRNLSDDTLYPVLKAIRFLGDEVEKLRGFVRFSDLSGVLGSEIEPKNRVLPVLRSHFCHRYQNERFFIYDRTHREVLLYANQKAVILPLEQFEMAPPSQEEAAFRMLWKRFYDTIAIPERNNPRCRMTHMPKRYWNTMTEFQDSSYFKVQDAPADAEAPSFPVGKSAPAKLSESARSDPASIP